MADSSLEGFSDRTGLRRALAERLREVKPDLRILAEGFLAESSAIDLLAVGAEGELVSIRFSKPTDDRATLTRALADLTWLRPRRADLLNLAPGLGIDPSVEPRALVVCHEFSAESLAAVDNFPDHTLGLWRCRGLQTGTGRELSLEPVGAKTLATQAALPRARPHASASSSTRLAKPASNGLTDPPSPSAFRSGLIDADLAPSQDAVEADGPLSI